MARYIDADVLIERLKFKRDETDKVKKKYSGLECAISQVQKQPTADVVEVVRCKDCKHSYINSFSAQSGVALCKFWSNRAEGNNLVVQQDDYCSYGERRCS